MSGWYTDGKESLLARTVPAAAGIYVVGVNEDYIFDPAHKDFTPITPHILLPETQLGAVNFDGGVLRASEPSWEAAGAGISDRSLVLKGVIIYFMLASEGTLLAYLDGPAVGLPETLTGAPVAARWSPQGILKL